MGATDEQKRADVHLLTEDVIVLPLRTDLNSNSHSFLNTLTHATEKCIEGIEKSIHATEKCISPDEMSVYATEKSIVGSEKSIVGSEK